MFATSMGKHIQAFRSFLWKKRPSDLKMKSPSETEESTKLLRSKTSRVLLHQTRGFGVFLSSDTVASEVKVEAQKLYETTTAFNTIGVALRRLSSWLDVSSVQRSKRQQLLIYQGILQSVIELIYVFAEVFPGASLATLTGAFSPCSKCSS